MLAHWARSTRRPIAGRAAGHAARLRAADAGRLPDASTTSRRRLAAGAARAAAVPEHRRGEPQRPARQLRPRRRPGARLGQPTGGPRRGRPPESGLRLRRMADGRRPDLANSKSEARRSPDRRAALEKRHVPRHTHPSRPAGRKCSGSRQVEIGEPGPGEARVRHTYVAVNFIDVYFRTGRYPMPLPNGLGSDAVGVVEAVGPGSPTSARATGSATCSARRALIPTCESCRPTFSSRSPRASGTAPPRP